MLRHVPAVCCVAALLAPSSARAATVLTFDREVATPGETIVVTALEAPDRAAATALTVYLVRLELVEELLGEDGAPAQREPEPGEGVIPLGVLEPGAGALGRLSFSVPELEPGRYTTGVWCVSCGGTFETSYRPGVTPPSERGLVLRVVPAPPAADDGGSVGGTVVRAFLAGLALVVLLVATYVVLANRRRRRSVLR